MLIDSLIDSILARVGTQAELARRLNVDKSSLSKYIRRERRPSILVMRHMAQILDLDFMEVVEAFYGPDDHIGQEGDYEIRH